MANEPTKIPRYARKKRRRVWESVPRREKAGVRRKLFRDQYGVCPICERSLDEEAATFDHAKPVIHGGRNGVDNLRLVHHECNQAKGHGTDGDARTKLRKAGILPPGDRQSNVQ